MNKEVQMLSQTPLLFGPERDNAAGMLASLYGETQKAFGFLPNAARLFGVSPPLLANQMRHIGFFSQHQTLSPGLLAFIRLLVSQRVQCDYCVDMNVTILLRQGIAEEAIRSAQRDPNKAPLPDREKALLNFVLAAVAEPRSIGEGEMDQIRDHGWSDQEIFEAVHHGAHAVAVDILLDTFKVPLD